MHLERKLYIPLPVHEETSSLQLYEGGRRANQSYCVCSAGKLISVRNEIN